MIELATFRSVEIFQCSTPKGNIRRKPESSFGENQLLQRSVSFSLQPTSHPKMLHNLRVRTSLDISVQFILLMGSSQRFGSDTNDERAIHTRFRCGSGGTLLSQAVRINSLAHSSIGTQSRHKPLLLLVDMWFQFYFTPLTGVLFTFPSRYLFTIDLKKYVALSVSTDEFTRAIHVSSYSSTTAIEMHRFRVRDYYPLGSHFPVCSSINAFCNSTRVKDLRPTRRL